MPMYNGSLCTLPSYKATLLTTGVRETQDDHCCMKDIMMYLVPFVVSKPS